MKFILKPIFEMITGEYVMFDNIIYNYIIMAIIGFFAFVIAWRCVGKLYDNNIISGKNSGLLIHWTIRLVVFIFLFYIFSLVIWITKFIYIHRKIIYIIISAIVALTIIIMVILKIRKKIINKNIENNKVMNAKIYNEDNITDNEIDEIVTRVKVFIINTKNELLYANSDGGIQLIGGHVEKEENLENAVKREVQEETGIVLQSEDITAPFFEIKYYTKNYKETGKNRISNVLYYFIKTDKTPDNSKMKLTANEVKKQFSYKYCSIDEFEKLLNSCVNCDSEINAIIAKEILVAFEELKKKL